MANNYPDDLRYTKDHEWIRMVDSSAGPIGVVGITAFAEHELGDIVYVDLPEIGKPIQQGKIFGTIESVKAVPDLNAPVSGEVVERNEELVEHPEMVNKDPHGKAWMIRIKLSNPGELGSLMSAADYTRYAETAGH